MSQSIGNSRSILLFILFITYSINGIGQSTSDAAKEKIIIDVRKQLVAVSSPDGELFELCAKSKVSGDFVVDLTVGAKGKVLTVFMVSSSPESIQNQNFLKSKLSDLQFEDIKISKTERVKFRHTLTF
ncbi:MAG: hypothetical protein WDN75_00405 [Bacteroidota bacterium]